MTIRRRNSSNWKSQKHSRKRREERLKRRNQRIPLLETLENRQLLAVGPQLAGIQPDEGALLRDGQVRDIAPRELVFHFNDGAAIDPSTLDGIRLTRSGGDGQFEKAIGTSDFNTDGRVVIDFTAVSPGESGNNIAIDVIKNQLGPSALPRVSVLGGGIKIELNSTAGSATTGNQLVAAINGNPQARQLVTASVRAGTNGNTDIATPPIIYSPIITSGANAASNSTNLNVGSSLQMKLTAKEAGPAGTGIEVVINGRNFGGVAPPRVTVSDRVITVEVNSNPAAPTTAGELVNAINAHPAASALVTATLPVGSPDTVIGNRVTGLRLELTGIGDIPIVPGFIGLGDSTRQVVMRFAEPLPDDLYRVEIIGSGPFALRNVVGGTFGDTTDDGVDNGTDFGLNFELNLGAQVLSVVPQPVTLNRQQFRDRIHVYFNDDDLHPTRISTGQLATNPSVVDPSFYQLLFTNDTVHNTDDEVYLPSLIQYDPASDLAILIFDEPLDELGSGPGTFRLRIGTDEAMPLPPLSTTAGFATASTDFNTAGGAVVRFTATADFASRVTVSVTKRNFNGPGAPVVSVSGQRVSIELNTNAGNQTTALQLVNAVNAHPQASQLLTAAIASGSPSTNIATPAAATTNLTLAGLGSSFDTASDLGSLTAQSLIFTSSIEPQPFELDFPGDEEEPGHRDLRPEVQRHFLQDVPDALDGIEVAFYNFEDEYGFDPLGNVLHNAITEAQKQRTREIFSLYSEYVGIQFVETENLGMTIVTGDLRGLPAATVPIPGPGGVLGAAVGGLTGTAIMDLQDFSNPGDDEFGGRWFLTAMHEIGHLLGIGHTDELPPPTIMNGQLVVPGTQTFHPLDFPENTVEPIFPGDHDIIHGQYLYRPDSKDIDLYRFRLPEGGRLSAETFAERQADVSMLDTVVSLYRQNTETGKRELIARNDDYYSNDSYLELDLPAGTYWIGVSAKGNDDYDPVIDDTGLGGRSQGDYELRLNFRPDADRTMSDSTGVPLDGDADGVPGGVFNTWFRVQTPTRTIFVDKSAPSGGNGTLSAPYQILSTALAAASSGEVVRVLGNGGADRNLATVEDNLAYEIGFNRLGTVLADGPTLQIPRGVTLMIDSGAILKLRRARIAVGSSTSGQTGGSVDRSGAALQILGTPILLDPFGNVVRDDLGEPIPGSVFMTSIHDEDLGLDNNPDSFPPAAVPGDWGGIVFQRNIDALDSNRFDWEREGIFLNVVNHADMRFGGGNVVIDGLGRAIAPIHMTDARPTIGFNRITQSADAAMSASPNSFEETNFHEPKSQFTPHTADYSRVGPDIYGNTAVDNSINGLFVRVTTPAGNATQPLIVSARWDDVDLPVVLAGQLTVQGTPGGAELDIDTPSVQLVTLTAEDGGTLPAGTYNYRVVFVDANGNEGAPSTPTRDLAIDPGSPQTSIRLDNLPDASGGFIARRIYRSDNTGNTAGAYVLVAEINVNATSFLDQGGSLGRVLSGSPMGTLRARLDARLAIDPGVVVKLNGGAIETTLGADFYAEGAAGREIIFTSIYDDRFGGGGTFDTTSDLDLRNPLPGDWGGLIGGQMTSFSLDSALIGYGGGTVDIEGAFASFNAVELHQSKARVAKSRFEHNDHGVSEVLSDRGGRGFNRESTIFVRGAQPILVSNTIAHSEGAAISIDANSLNAQGVRDTGRSTYNARAGNQIERFDVALDNAGPLVRLNRLENNNVNGMQVRGGTLTTEGVWDDTDIVHVILNESIYVPDFHTRGGLRLESSASESLVVKLDGPEAGFSATGRPLDINDRIGGALQMVGQPAFPVVITSFSDDTVGAGFTPDELPQIDTNNDGDFRDTDGELPVFTDTVTVPTLTNNANLLRDALLGPGVTPIGNATFVGSATSAGLFLGGGNAIGLEEGIVLTSGDASFAAGPNVADFSTGVASGAGDPNLDAEFNVATQDTTFLQFDFMTDSGDVFFNYVFASEEYNEFANSPFNDVFAFFLDGQNIALIPGTATPVAINNINGGNPLGTNAVNPQFYVNNDPGDGGTFLNDVGYDGFTTVFTASATNIGPGIHTIKLAVSDVTDSALDTGVFLEAGTFAGVFTRGRTPVSGDWRSIRLDEYSHDRNVESVTEVEGANVAAPGNNAIPEDAQFLGSLAPNEKSGDENLRLGFEVQGFLSAPADIDIYSFNAQPGAEVWFDIDNTRNSLDTVVELIDSSGVVLARSDNALAEASDPSLLFRGPGVATNRVNPLSKQGYDPANPSIQSNLAIPDRFTTNPRDAGMRVVLPGQPGVSRPYFVRVRSSSGDVGNLNGGLTFGNYQLQIRLRELDEVPGSTVRYSDIRYATNGIEVLGQPAHSPLLGEAAETENYDQFTGTFTNSNSALGSAQDIGNLAQADRGAISVSGNIQVADDVDYYRLEVAYDSIQPSSPNKHLAAIFDIDYADGFGRANTVISVFDADGRLILSSKGSNVADDRPRALQGTDTTDLTRGSAGVRDPFLGPVELPAGPQLVADAADEASDRAVYYVAVSSNAQMPEELLQFLEPNPPNPFVRLEPINSIRRIAEDRIGVLVGNTSVAEAPVIPVLVDPVESVVPFKLGDVVLFVNQDVGLAPQTSSTLHYVDPFTGFVEATAGSFPEPLADIAIRGDGNVFGYTIGPDNFNGLFNDATIGTYVQIDTGTAASTKLNDDGVETNVQMIDPANPGQAERAPLGNNNDGVGVIWDAMTFRFDSNTQFNNGFVVGSRPDAQDNSADRNAQAGTAFMENTLFHFDINNGVVANRNPPSQNRMGNGVLNGVGTQKIEFGEILTFTRIVPQNPGIGDTFTITINGQSISYTVAGTPIDIGNNTIVTLGTPEEVVAGLATEWQTAALTIPEFAAFEVLNNGSFPGPFANSVHTLADELRVRLTNPAFATVDIEASTINGDFSAFESMSVEGFGPGGRVTGIDFVGNSMYAVTDRGGLYEVSLFGGGGGFFSSNLATYVRSSAIDLMTSANGQPIEFSGLTTGPNGIENGEYANMLFGITTDGEIYAFDTTGELQPIFVNNQTSVETGLFGVSGLAFSNLDRNLWQVTGNRGNDEGHGFNGPQNTYEPFDHSRLDLGNSGGSSFFFGNDRSANEGGNQSFSNTAFVRDYNFAGGAHGTIISNPFSLEGYSPADLPVMYFNYFLGTEGTDYDPTTNPVTPTRDTLRVFVSDDGGDWTLVASNNTFQDAVLSDEFDIGQDDLLCAHPSNEAEPCVQKLFDNAGWRQARIPLGRFSGSANLRIKFDFSTAGEMNVGNQFTVGSELRAIDGKDLRDGQSFALDFSNRLEFDLGYTLVAPNGAAIQDGDSFTVSPDGTRNITFEFDNDGSFRQDITASAGINFRDGQTFFVRSGNQTATLEFESGSSLLVPSAGANALTDGETFSINGVIFEFDSDGNFAGGNNIINLIVDQGLRVPAAGGGPNGLTDGEAFTINDGVGGPDVVFEFDSDGVASIGARAVDITNIELQVPIAGAGFGGIRDGDTFTISDGFGGQPVIFEFDKDNIVAAGNQLIFVSDSSTQNDVANAIVNALLIAGIGVSPVNQGGGVVRLGVVNHQVDTSGSPTLTDRVIAATANEVADRMVNIILNAGLGLTPVNAGAGVVRLGSTTHVVDASAAPNLTQQTVRGNQDEMADLIVTGIEDAGLSLTPVNLGGGEVFLGQTTSLDTSGASALSQRGTPGLSDPTATAVPFTPTQSANQVAASITAAVNAALGINAVTNGNVVDLPASASFSPNGTALAPANVVAVAFGADLSAAAIAANIEDAMTQAFLPVNLTADLTAESNDRFATAVVSGITGGPTNFQAQGTIGDNLAFPFERGRDVDFLRMNFASGDHVSINASAAGSSLQPALQLFNSQGQLLRTGTGFSPQIDFTAVAGGTYYIAVSSSSNLNYNPNFDGSADVTLVVPAQGGAIGGLTDGESFSIVQGNNTPVVFEFDANGVVSPTAIPISLNDILLQIPSAAAGAGGIQDGNSFIINDNEGSGSVVFEFDTGWQTSPGGQPVVSPGSIPILISPFFDTAASIASSTAAAIAGANLGLNPQIRGGSTIQLFTTNHTVNSSGTPTMAQLTTPRTQQQVVTLLTEAIRTAGVGLSPTQSFGGNLTLDVRDHTIDTTLAPNLTKIIPTNTGAYDLTIDIVQPFEVYRNSDRVNLPSAEVVTQTGLPTTFISGQPGVTANSTAVKIHAGMTRVEVAQAAASAIGESVAGYIEQIVAVPGADIGDGEIFSLSDGDVTVNFEFESGYSMQIPDLSIDPNAHQDGEFFVITKDGVATRFEFDDNGLVTPGNIGLRFNDVVMEIPGGGVTEDTNGNGQLDLIIEDLNGNGILDPGEDLNGNGFLDVFNEDRNFNGLLDPGIVDGNTFSINRGPGTPTVVFEYDTNGISGFGNRVISITTTADEVAVANATVQALNTAGLNLNARIVGRGQPTGGLFGTASVLIQLGISNHNVDLTLTPTLTRGTVLRTQDEMGDLIVQAITGAGLSLSPTYLGNGTIHLGGDASHTLDLSNAVTLSSTGLPGPADPTAIVIPVFPSDTVSPADVSQLILAAINTARVNRGLNVTAVADGARRINLLGQTVTTDFSQAPSLPVHRSGDTVTSYQNIVDVVGHTISDPGPLGMEDSLAGDAFGAFEISGPPNANQYPGALRGMDNAHEGAYVDDIIIGFAERGEIVTGSALNSTMVPNLELLNPDLPVGFVPHGEVHLGEYTLEVRRAEEFGVTIQDPSPELFLQRSFDTNDRLTSAVTLEAPAGHSVVEAQTFTISDSLNTVTFEFDDLALNNGVQPTHIRIPYRTTDTAPEIGRRIRDAINSPQAQALLRITAAMADGVTTGAQMSPTSPASTSQRVNLFGNAVLGLEASATVRNETAVEPNDTIFVAIDTGIGTEDVTEYVATGNIGDNSSLANISSDVDMFSVELTGGQTINIDIDARQLGSTLDPILTVYDSLGQFVAFNDDFDGFDSFIQFIAPQDGTFYVAVSGFSNFFPSPFVAGSGGLGTFSTGDYTLRISTDSEGFRVQEYEDLGDSGIVREQGQVLIHSNRIVNSREFGIVVDAGPRDGNGNSPHQGPVRTTREVNHSGLVTGVVLMNNVVARGGTGGIRFSGTPVAPGEQPGALSFGRIVNNTIFGDGTGVGIQIDENVSPTVLNNILSGLATGLLVDMSTFGPLAPGINPIVLGGTVYHSNTANVTGTTVGASAIFLADTDPLFVNTASDNFYLAPGSRAIDSSINTLQDRPELLAIKSPLGFSPSPILAPDLDAIGQTRVDDPSVASPPGQGSNVFKDRGALDRADFAGPAAVLINPQDNDSLGLDSDGRVTFVNLTNQVVRNFSIQLLDGIEPNDPRDGTGADDTSVRRDRVTVFRDGQRLTEGVDYKFSYDATNNVIRLAPLAGVWEIDRKYEIELSNSRGLLLTAPNGTEVADGDSFDLTDEFGNTVTFEFDSGYVLQVPQTLAIQIPATGGANIQDRDSFIVTNSDTGATVVFEFDLDGFTTVDNVPIPFTTSDSANDIANAIVTAIQTATASHGLSPVNIVNFGGRAVHLGTRSIHGVDVSNTSFATTGQVAGIDDGQTFLIDNGQTSVVFEFSSTGGVTTGDRAIPFSFSQTNEEIAQAVVTAIQAANLGLSPMYMALSDGLINLGGEPRHVLDATNSPLVVTGQPGANPAFGMKVPTLAGQLDLTTIMDGEEFTISNGTNSLTIELDNDGVVTPDDPDSHPRRVVTFNASTTVDQFVNAISVAIRQGNVGLSPTNAGFGVIQLGGTAQHTLDLSLSSFAQLGQPGVPASIPVPFKAGDFFEVGVPSRMPIFSAEEMAESIENAIQLAESTGRLREVSAVARGDEVNIEGITNVGGLATSVRADIVDVAGNPLKPNRDDGTTRFTIAVGSGVDYGDAPEGYPVTLAESGASHEVVGDFFLGSSVDVDFDGQHSPLADGDDLDNLDDEDGVVVNGTLQGGFVGAITVTASAAGFLDAWIDFDQDGVWEANEQIFNRQPLAAGANPLAVAVPGTALPGTAIGRFRLSSVGGLPTTGHAADGEVEDHRIMIVGNPWHNASNRWDTDDDDFVVPLDALRIINFLNLNPLNIPTTGPNTGKLPATRPPSEAYVDVNGDGFATAIDVLQVINRIDEGPTALAEGEGSFATTLASSTTSDDLSRYAARIVVDHRVADVYDQQDALRQPIAATTSIVDSLWPAEEDADDEVAQVEASRGQDDLVDEDLLEMFANETQTRSLHDEVFGQDWL